MHEGVNRGHRVGRKSEALWGRDLSEGHPRHIVSPFRYCYHTARGLVDNSFLFGIEFDVVLQFPNTYHVERGVWSVVGVIKRQLHRVALVIRGQKANLAFAKANSGSTSRHHR